MVKKWLDGGNHEKCPFQTGNDKSPHHICDSWFPKSDQLEECPCQTYALSTVRRRAHEMIRFNGKEGGKK
jgi:hypothetical protein